MQPTVMIALGILGLCAVFMVFLVVINRRMRERLDLQKRIWAIFDHAPAEIYLKDREGRYIMISRQFERLFGVKNADVVGLLPTDVHDPELGAATRAHDLSVLTSGKTLVREEEAFTQVGRKFLHTIKFPTRDDMGLVNGLGAVVTDITELVETRERAVRAEAELKTQSETLVKVLSLSGIGCWSCELESKFAEVDDNFCAILGLPQSSRLKRGTLSKMLSGPAGPQRAQDIALALNKGARLEEEVEVRSTLGQELLIRLVGDPVFVEGKLFGYQGFLQDITAYGKERARLEDIARTDFLTGILNRRGMAARAADLKAQARQDRIVVVADLDNFKFVNDTFGHKAGDDILKLCVKMFDTAAEFDFVARTGGDEFVLVARRGVREAEVLQALQRFVSRTAQTLEGDRIGFVPNLSIGYTDWDLTENEAFDDAMNNADLALQAVKGRAWPRIMKFGAQMRQDRDQHTQMLTDMKAGLEQGAFECYFQPQVNVTTGQMIGAEALARWRHPTRGLLRAQDFIGFARKNLLLRALDLQILDKTCAFLNQQAALGAKPMRISVNMSELSLNHEGVCDEIGAILQAHNVPFDQIGIEVTEDVILGPSQVTVTSNIKRLRQMGLSIALDDFGTGYASLSSLIELPVDRLKIDRSFVNGIDAQKSKRQMTELLVQAAFNLGICVVAEGIETQEQQRVLLKIGCPAIQGRLVSAPLEAAAFSAWLAARPAFDLA